MRENDWFFNYSLDEEYNDDYYRNSYPFVVRKRTRYIECDNEQGEIYDDEYQYRYEN